MTEAREKFWTGAIQSRGHAEKVISYTAGTFAILGGLLALTLFQGLDVSKVLTVLILAVPALALLRTKGVIPAGFFVGLSALSVILSVATSIYEALGGDEPQVAWAILPVGAIWLVLGYVAWRGFVAARYLKRNAPSPSVEAAA